MLFVPCGMVELVDVGPCFLLSVRCSNSKHCVLVIWLLLPFPNVPFLDVDIDNEFKTFLEQLAPLLLDPSRLIIKRINGNIVTGRGLVECFKVSLQRGRVCVCCKILYISSSVQAYMKIFESDELPEPKSMLRVSS